MKALKTLQPSHIVSMQAVGAVLTLIKGRDGRAGQGVGRAARRQGGSARKEIRQGKNGSCPARAMRSDIQNR